jgi:HEAT repeat protein
MQRTRALSRRTVLTALFGTAALSGCGGEERGPILAGGREVKAWVADLHNPKPQVRRQAVLKLGNAGDTDPAVAEALAEALRDADPLVRSDAILAVVKLKQPGAAIKDQLETMSRSDKNARARDLAGKALEHIGKTE